MPFYIFCESYGGKMVAAFGTLLHKVKCVLLVCVCACVCVCMCICYGYLVLVIDLRYF